MYSNDIFSFMYEEFKFKHRPIRLFEAFAGMGTQAMALKRLGIEIEHVGISEIDKYALIAHKAIHGEVKNYGGIGSFERLPKDIDICTWSFPCQDISMAGRQKGMSEGTRSNYGYVFLDTVENTPYNERPKVLIMENVEALITAPFKYDWENIHLRLEKLGYQSYSKVLAADDYGIPQTRNRVFVVSILGEYSFSFPNKMPLERTLKYFLEKEVDEKYYLTDGQVEQIKSWNAYQKPLESAKSVDDEKIQTITAKSNTSMNAGMILIKEGKLYDFKSSEKFRRELGTEVAPTLRTSIHFGVGTKDLRIRKLTPREAFRLMGIDDKDFDKVKNAGVSDAQLYKLAGNAIVVDVLYYLFKQLF